ncbi:MAG: ABC transporter permease [Gammaproteobacteria bacterium]|nr:ABC transporter permease [Gammaproteobacteria bacterium]
MGADNTVIDIRNVVKTYTLGEVEVHALRNVDLIVEHGEFLAIMGASGSGKSTLMNIIGCLDRPTSGSYMLEGRDVAALNDKELAHVRNLRIGYVFQNFNLLTRTSAAENVTLPLFYSGHMENSAERVKQALANIGLAGREQNYPSQLSGGQQQRVAIARALINSPAILLADEPTGNLDSKTAEDIVATIQSINRQHGVTIVMVTHEPDIAAFADRVITMRDGAIISDQRQVAQVATHTLTQTPDFEQTPFDVSSTPHLSEIELFIRMALPAAWRALIRNKMRSALTMLGIFIGVAALITMVAVGQGASASVKAQIESLGTNMIIIMPGATTASGVRGGSGSASTLTVADADALKKDDLAVAAVAVQDRQLAQLQYGSQNWNTSVQGISPNYLNIRNWAVVAGRAMTEADNLNARRVALLGQTVVKNLFSEHENPIGATIFIKNVPVEIIGVLQAKGQTGFGQDQDDVALLPFTTAEQKVLGVSTPSQTQTNPYIPAPPPNPFGLKPKLIGYVNTIFVEAVSTDMVPVAVQQITDTLSRRHHIQTGQPNDFAVRNISDITQAAESSSKIMSVLLATVASISLLVGGIGIMNIMLVSVTERTREIGIRMAIGAQRIHVLLQFLVESALLSVIGGGVGIVVGVIISMAISAFAGWPTLLSISSMVIAFLFSAAVGVFFGYYPARRASQLNPIEALRFE